MRSEIDVNNSMIESFRGLEEMRTQLQGLTVKQNTTVKREESLADLDSGTEKLKIGLKNSSNLKFTCLSIS